jgi:hypothetical protein
MHGSTSLLTAGPETSNYERKSNGDVYSAKLKIEIPSEVVRTHKVLLSWTIGRYRASVNHTTGNVPDHDHNGYALIGGQINSGFTGDDGGFTPDVGLDGGFTPSMLGKAHSHTVTGELVITFTAYNRLFIGDRNTEYENGHKHSNPNTGNQNRGHTHSLPTYTGAYDNDDEWVADDLSTGSACTSGYCITGIESVAVPSTTHYHSLGGSTGGISQSHVHTQGATGVGTVVDPLGHYHALATEMYYVIDPTTFGGYLTASVAANEDPAHIHDGNEEADHDHQGVAELDHSHITVAVVGHVDHAIPTESGAPLTIDYGIHEELAGTVLELVVNGEIVGEYSGDQTEIRIDGYLTSGSQTIEIQPIASEVGKKGGASIWASGVLFVEPKQF